MITPNTIIGLCFSLIGIYSVFDLYSFFHPEEPARNNVKSEIILSPTKVQSVLNKKHFTPPTILPSGTKLSTICSKFSSFAKPQVGLLPRRDPRHTNSNTDGGKSVSITRTGTTTIPAYSKSSYTKSYNQLKKNPDSLLLGLTQPKIWIPNLLLRRYKRSAMDGKKGSDSEITSLKVGESFYFRLPTETLEDFVRRLKQHENEDPQKPRQTVQRQVRRDGYKSQERPRSRSKSRERSRSVSQKLDPEDPNNRCRAYEKLGYCKRGATCSYIHDYNKPLTTQGLRIQLDILNGGLFKIRNNQQHLQSSLDANREEMKEGFDKILSELKKIGLSSRDAVQQPHTSKRQDIKERAQTYSSRSGYKF